MDMPNQPVRPMTDFMQCIPQDARPHFIQRRNIKQEAARAEHNAKLSDFRNDMAFKNNLNSGHALHRQTEMKIEFIDKLAMSNVEAALETMKLYEAEFTPQFAACLTQASEDFLTRQLQNVIQTGGHQSGHGPGIRRRLLSSDVQQINIRITGRSFSAMQHIKVAIEEARVADVKRRRDMKKDAEKTPTNNTTYQQTVNQYAPGSAASMLGDAIVNNYTQNDFNQLTVDLEAIRTALKSQPSTVDGDETIGLLAGAEKASSKGDEAGVKGFLGQIGKSGWEIVKSAGVAVTSEVVKGYLRGHGVPIA